MGRKRKRSPPGKTSSSPFGSPLESPVESSPESPTDKYQEVFNMLISIQRGQKWRDREIKSSNKRWDKEIKSSNERRDKEIEELNSKIAEHEKSLKKLKPVRKKFAKDLGLSLVNEFIGFISQIHGTGMQQKFSKDYDTGKFNKLAGISDFETNCGDFLKLHQGDSTVNPSDQLF